MESSTDADLGGFPTAETPTPWIIDGQDTSGGKAPTESTDAKIATTTAIILNFNFILKLNSYIVLLYLFPLLCCSDCSRIIFICSNISVI